MVKINGKDNLMNEGGIAAGVSILKVYPDSIRVSFSGDEKTVLK